MNKHTFEIQGSFTGPLSGKGFFKGNHLESEFSAPASTMGAGVGTNPEELLAAAANSCFLISMGAAFGFQNLPVASLELKTEIVLSTEGGLKVTALTHTPKITLPPGSTEETRNRALALIARAETFCIISKAIAGNVEITVNPEVTL